MKTHYLIFFINFLSRLNLCCAHFMKTIHLPTYAAKIHIYLTEDPVATFNKLTKKYPGLGDKIPVEDLTIKALYACLDDDIGTYFLILPPDAKSSLIAHECFHLVLCLMHDYGLSITTETETGAYLIEHLVEEVAQYLIKNQNARKKDL